MRHSYVPVAAFFTERSGLCIDRPSHVTCSVRDPIAMPDQFLSACASQGARWVVGKGSQGGWGTSFSDLPGPTPSRELLPVHTSQGTMDGLIPSESDIASSVPDVRGMPAHQTQRIRASSAIVRPSGSSTWYIRCFIYLPPQDCLKLAPTWGPDHESMLRCPTAHHRPRPAGISTDQVQHDHLVGRVGK